MSTNSKIGFALVGCGRIARKHAEILSQGLVERGKLVAVCDVKPDRAEIFAEVFKAPAFTDMHEMMLQMGNQVDVISVLTESGNHAQAHDRSRALRQAYPRREADGADAGGRRSHDPACDAARHQALRGQAEPLQPADSQSCARRSTRAASASW